MKPVVLAVSVALALGLAGCSKEEKEAAKVVSFKNDVAPILKNNCLACHKPGGEGHIKSGLMMSTPENPDEISYENLMKGTKFGPIIVPGDPTGSTLNMLVEGRADPSLRMPHGSKTGLPEQDIKTLHEWVAQGAKNN